ncbi:MAG: Uma2 family endonuclease [Planctomycetaceae bacterium]|nr:Uma2 family endonuclease [Planctomycetaceae bacterium]
MTNHQIPITNRAAGREQIRASESQLTAEDYFQTHDPYERSELLRGIVVPLECPGFQHGLICGQANYVLQRYLEDHPVGRVLSNDSGVITQRDPDTVRGGDVTFYSYDRVPENESPDGYPNVSPNVVFEVRSPNDRWSEIHEKIAEYLRAGVELVCVLVPETAAAHLFYPDRPGEIRQGDEELTLPAPLSEFRQPISRFFAGS